MKVSDYIVEYLIHQGIRDVFGYPGGMITHLMDSFDKYRDRISAHVTYHEQAAAFAACGYALTSRKPGIAYATSGPGATNLITGIANAYFDSIPTIFITGQVNTNESKGILPVRQRGFQETDMISLVRSITKNAVYIDQADQIIDQLDKAYKIAMEGRKGPVLLDIPMNILQREINGNKSERYNINATNSPELSDSLSESKNAFYRELVDQMRQSHRPCLLLGNGIKLAGLTSEFRRLVNQLKIPVVTSMLAFDLLPSDENQNSYNYGFIGAYGHRTANFILAKSDLIVSIGTRLDVRQVGAKRDQFAPQAKIIRVDIDEGELAYPVNSEEKSYVISINDALGCLTQALAQLADYSPWLVICNEIRDRLTGEAQLLPNQFIRAISALVPDGQIITTDVGQNQVWIAQSFQVKPGQEVLFSGGHGAMGFSLPAAIGAYYGAEKPVVSISGDGGFQMNIQELQYIAREKIPIKMIVLNNSSLGMIRHFQEMYFEDRFVQTLPQGGYSAPDFCAIANAYGINNMCITELNDLQLINFYDNQPQLIEIKLDERTYVYPKLEFGKPNQDQEPLISRELFDYLMSL